MPLNITDLKESNDFLKMVLANVDSVILLVDEQLRVIHFNDSFKVLFQKDFQENYNDFFGNLSGCAFSIEENVACGDGAHCCECFLKNSLRKTLKDRCPVSIDKSSHDFYIRGQRLKKYLRYSVKPIQYYGRDLALVIISDMTDNEHYKNRIEEQNKVLESLNRDKNEYLGFAAHDLRNPIMVIKSYASFMLQEMNGNLTGPQLDFLRKILKTSEFIGTLVDDLLDLVKIEAGRLELSPEFNDYSSLVRENIALNQILADKKRIRISLSEKGHIPHFYFDSNKIEQVLNNLLDNSVKYSEAGSEVGVEVSAEGEHVSTTVVDSGPGLAEEDLPRLFNAFFTGDGRTPEEPKRAGLGLCIVRKIVEAHGGRIEAKNLNGKGCAFRFSLPRVLRI